MGFCLQLDKLKHISHEEFERLNWLPMTYRFKQCVNSMVFKYFNELFPKYLNEVFDVVTESNFQLRSSNVHFERLERSNLLEPNPSHSNLVIILISSNIVLKNIS